MPKATDMMILPVDARRAHFRPMYTIELGRLHATGHCFWPAEQLPTMVDRVMRSIASRQMPRGPAIDATLKAFNIKTQKALFAFLEY